MEYFIGLRTGVGLILAIGAQNAFVLRQGIRREYVWTVVLICALSDAILIAAGVAGIGAAVEALPWLLPVLKWGGVAFLLEYGRRSFVAAWKGGAKLVAGEGEGMTRRAAVLTCLAFTWLNPHVYIDTVVLLGSISAQFEGREWVFGAGAMTGSFVFFVTLGFGARLMGPLFANPSAWRVLDGLVGLMMWSVALQLALYDLS